MSFWNVSQSFNVNCTSGFKLKGAGIDDAIWFKFKTDIPSVQEICDVKIADHFPIKKTTTLYYSWDERIRLVGHQG